MTAEIAIESLPIIILITVSVIAGWVNIKQYYESKNRFEEASRIFEARAKRNADRIKRFAQETNELRVKLDEKRKRGAWEPEYRRIR